MRSPTSHTTSLRDRSWCFKLPVERWDSTLSAKLAPRTICNIISVRTSTTAVHSAALSGTVWNAACMGGAYSSAQCSARLAATAPISGLLDHGGRASSERLDTQLRALNSSDTTSTDTASVLRHPPAAATTPVSEGEQQVVRGSCAAAYGVAGCQTTGTGERASLIPGLALRQLAQLRLNDPHGRRLPAGGHDEGGPVGELRPADGSVAVAAEQGAERLQQRTVG